jgi:hypothetical protein
MGYESKNQSLYELPVSSDPTHHCHGGLENQTAFGLEL